MPIHEKPRRRPRDPPIEKDPPFYHIIWIEKDCNISYEIIQIIHCSIHNIKKLAKVYPRISEKL